VAVAAPRTAHDGPAGAYTFGHLYTAVPFLAGAGWGLWSQEGDELVIPAPAGVSTCEGSQSSALHAGEYDVSIGGAAVPARCTDAGIEFST
jgi:hypothetical protein